MIQYKAIHNRARAIALALNEVDAECAWTSRPVYEHSAEIIREDGVSLTMRRFHNVIDRIEFLPHYPRPKHGTAYVHSFYGEYERFKDIGISVAESRDDIAIAKAILSRFLPLYLQAYAYVVERNNEYNAMLDETRETVKIVQERIKCHEARDLDSLTVDLFPHAAALRKISVHRKTVSFEAATCDLDAALVALTALADAKREE